MFRIISYSANLVKKCESRVIICIFFTWGGWLLAIGRDIMLALVKKEGLPDPKSDNPVCSVNHWRLLLIRHYRQGVIILVGENEIPMDIVTRIKPIVKLFITQRSFESVVVLRISQYFAIVKCYGRRLYDRCRGFCILRKSLLAGRKVE